MRRKREDRGRDDSVEIDLILDAMERLEDVIADILDIVQDIREKVTPEEVAPGA